MVRVRQTKFGKKGNCLAACIASILNCEIDDIPNVETLFTLKGKHENLWSLVMVEFLKQHGVEWAIVDTDPLNPDPIMQYAYLLVVGYGLESGELHYTIYRNGKQYHDPSPNKKGIDERDIKQVSCLFLNTENGLIPFSKLYEETEFFSLKELDPSF